jgi:hypothetical protein
MNTRRASAPTILSSVKTSSTPSSVTGAWEAIRTIEDTFEDTMGIEDRAEWDRAALEAWQGFVAIQNRKDVGYKVGDGRWSPRGGVHFYE